MMFNGWECDYVLEEGPGWIAFVAGSFWDGCEWLRCPDDGGWG